MTDNPGAWLHSQCSVFGCPTTSSVHIAEPNDLRAMVSEAVSVLRQGGWMFDLLGALCPIHRNSHRLGARQQQDQS